MSTPTPPAPAPAPAPAKPPTITSVTTVELKGVAAWVLTHLTLAAALAMAAFIAVYFWLVRPAELKAARESALAEAALKTAADKVGAAEGALATERQLHAQTSAQLQAVVAALQKANSGAHQTEHSQATVALQSQKPLIPEATQPPAPSGGYKGPYLFQTADHQVTVSLLPEPTANLNLLFGLEGVVVSSPEGAKFGKLLFHQYDPVTKAEIPNTDAKVDYNFSFTKEEVPQPSPWHPRLVALYGTPGGGLGAQINPWKVMILTLGGAYGKASGLAAVGGIGTRLKFPWLDSTLGLSLSVDYGKGGLFHVGGIGTVELTR